MAACGSGSPWLAPVIIGYAECAMTPHEFIAKWRASELKERSASREHFIDLCRLLGEPTPAEADPSDDAYCFERGARKDTGGDGRIQPTIGTCQARSSQL